MKLYRAFPFALVLVGLGMVHPVVAQEAEPKPAPSARSQKYTYEEVKIIGKIVKPQVQFIISREKGVGDEALVLKDSFIPRILESVEEAPF